ALFTSLGHRVWLVMGVISVVATTLGVASVRTPAKAVTQETIDDPETPDVPLVADVPGSLVEEPTS
ncbi:MAG: hypothetical protein JO144_09950, partial [Actinobacteria bacterium]|nr:hypothetical protein [Actinomycetota bacterium]